VFFMSTVCGRPQGGKGGVRPMWTEREGGQKRDFFVDVINGWPLSRSVCQDKLASVFEDVNSLDVATCIFNGFESWFNTFYHVGTLIDVTPRQRRLRILAYKIIEKRMS